MDLAGLEPVVDVVKGDFCAFRIAREAEHRLTVFCVLFSHPLSEFLPGQTYRTGTRKVLSQVDDSTINNVEIESDINR